MNMIILEFSKIYNEQEIKIGKIVDWKVLMLRYNLILFIIKAIFILWFKNIHKRDFVLSFVYSRYVNIISCCIFLFSHSFFFILIKFIKIANIQYSLLFFSIWYLASKLIEILNKRSNFHLALSTKNPFREKFLEITFASSKWGGYDKRIN